MGAPPGALRSVVTTTRVQLVAAAAFSRSGEKAIGPSGVDGPVGVQAGHRASDEDNERRRP